MRLCVLFFSAFLLVTCVGAVRCNSSTLWNLARGSPLLAKLFEHDGAAGIERALAYFETSGKAGRAGPYFPQSWDVFAGVFQDCAEAGAQSISSVGTPASVRLQLSALALWRGYFATGIGVVDPHARVVYDSYSDQYYTGCEEGHVCASDSSSSGLDPGTTLVIIASVALVVILIALLAYAVWRLEKIWRVLRPPPETPLLPKELEMTTFAPSHSRSLLDHFILPEPQ
jgi:hypothetical protein